MPKRDDFPIWARNRARRHAARGCSPRLVGLILGPDRARASPAVAEALPTNVLPFRTPMTLRRRRFAPALGDGLRHG